MRLLSEFEHANAEVLRAYVADFALLELTATGIEKSILDATAPVRNYFAAVGVHDYGEQLQGPEHKVLLTAAMLSPLWVHPTKISVYRPLTKLGDPRLWVYELRRLAEPGDIVALFFFERIYVANLTRQDWSSLSTEALAKPRPDLEILVAVRASRQAPSQELRLRLLDIARDWIPAPCIGDTAVGRAVESALGIPMNARKTPDYRGIELKARRAKGKNRANLYSQVPDWARSELKSSAQLLEKFGYNRGSVRKLYCTLSGRVENSQGLRLEVDVNAGALFTIDMGNVGFRVVRWDLGLLQSRLREKHAETFWIDAETRSTARGEEFRLLQAEHTARPYYTRLPDLLASGAVSVDFLIKRDECGVHDKGYLFKLKHGGLNLLFPPSSVYVLR